MTEFTLNSTEASPGLTIAAYSKMVKLSFSEWLAEQMLIRGWTQAQLARAAKVRRGTIGNILNKVRQPGPEVLLSIAKALDLPPDLVFAKAGVLPAPKDGATDEERKWLHIFDQAASDEERAELLERAELELARLREKRKGKSTP